MIAEPIEQSFVLHGLKETTDLWHLLQREARSSAAAGSPLRVTVSQREEGVQDGQTKHYWGHILKDIAAQVVVDGKRFPAPVWHEHFAMRFLPMKEVQGPYGPMQVRSSTGKGQISKRDMAEYIRQVEAHAASELGVRFVEYDQSKWG